MMKVKIAIEKAKNKKKLKRMKTSLATSGYVWLPLQRRDKGPKITEKKAMKEKVQSRKTTVRRR